MGPVIKPPSGKIIPFGYAGNGGMARLLRLLGQETKPIIVDIRLVPSSHWQRDFNKYALAKRFNKQGRPVQYMHVAELGNLNYRPEDRQKGIALANQERGMARLIHGLAQGYTIILLCACKGKGCHRWTVIDLLKASIPGVQIDGMLPF